MAKTKIVIALVALAAVALVAEGLASAQIATQPPNATIGAAPNNGFWGYLGRCFQFWVNGPVDQTTGAPITGQVTPPQNYNAPTLNLSVPNGYGFRSGCMTRYW